MSTRTSLITAAIAAGLAAVIPAAASAQAPPPSVTLSPAIAEGTARAGIRVGPFGIRNGTPQAYDLRMVPVLLGQARDGGLFVRLDAASRAEARSLMEATRSRAGFAPGAQLAAGARVLRVPPRQGLYGGLLFEAAPRRAKNAAEPQIASVLRLNARVLLDPPVRQRRISFAAARVRAEQAGERRLALRVPVTNRGNTFAAIGGTVTVADASGREVARVPIRRIRVLPGATVELSRRLTTPLPAGDYRLTASLRSGSHRVEGRGDMRLVATSEVPTRSAKLVTFSPPRAYRGERADVRATFRNTGNVAFAPTAELVVRRTGGDVVARLRATAERAAPGRTATLRTSFDVPSGSGPLELTVRMTSADHTLDERTASVTPADRPPLLTRVSDAVTEHAITVLVLAVLPLLAALVSGARYVRRLQTRLREAQGEAR
jgi:hypothetical protein